MVILSIIHLCQNLEVLTQNLLLLAPRKLSYNRVRTQEEILNHKMINKNKKVNKMLIKLKTRYNNYISQIQKKLRKLLLKGLKEARNNKRKQIKSNKSLNNNKIRYYSMISIIKRRI
jgi:hypothetical protein